MSTIIQSSLALPSLPKGYKAPSFSPLSGKLSTALQPDSQLRKLTCSPFVKQLPPPQLCSLLDPPSSRTLAVS